jgi:hypothetical protein
MTAISPIARGDVVDASWFEVLGEYAPDIGDKLIPADEAVDLFWACYWEMKAGQGLVLDERLGVWVQAPETPVDRLVTPLAVSGHGMPGNPLEEAV